MNNQDNQELIKQCTDTMSIDIDNIPKNVCFEVAEVIGNVLEGFGLEFDYSGIVKGFSDEICGLQFDIESGDLDD